MSINMLLEIPSFKRSTFKKKHIVIKNITKVHGIGSLVPSPFPPRLKHASTLFRFHSEHSGLLNELEWTALILGEFASELARFVNLRRRLEHARLVSDWILAQELLNSIHAAFGVSFCFYEKQFEVFHRSAESEGDSGEILDIVELESDASVRFLLAANFFRYHPLYGYAAYSKILENNLSQLTEWKESHVLNALYHADSASPFNHHQLASILANSSTKPIIDQYEVVLFIINTLSEELLNKEERRRFVAVKAYLFERIADPRLRCSWGRLPPVEAGGDLRSPNLSWVDIITSCNCAALIESLQNCQQVAESAKISDSYLSILANVVDSIIEPQQDIQNIVSALQDWSSKFGRCALTRSLYQLSRYLGGYSSLREVSPQLQKLTPNRSFSPLSLSILDRFTQFERAKHRVTEGAQGDLKGISISILEEWKLNPWSPRVAGIREEFIARVKEHPLDDLDDLAIVTAYGLIDQGVGYTSSVDAYIYFAGVESISELPKVLPEIQLWIYDIFARNNCGLAVLKEIPSIGETMQEVRSERIKILKYLLSKSESPSDVFRNEVFELEKRNRIEGANVVIDQSRMMVDRATLAKKIEQIFEARVGNLSVQDLGHTFLSSLQVYALGVFLLDQDCGFDAVLSGRVRHGNLRERLRSPFSRTGLAFIKRSGSYEAPDHWWNIVLAGDDEREILMETVISLSSELDEKINKFIKEKIQLRMEEFSWEGFSGMMSAKNSPDGLIDIGTILESSTRILLENIAGVNSLTTLVEVSIESIWKAIEPELAVVRDGLQIAFKQELHQILERYLGDLNKFPERQRNSIRDASGRCRSEITAVCEETARWFELPKELSPPKVNVGEMVELVAESIRRFIGGGFSPEVQSGGDLEVAQNFFSDFYDLINLCLINIVEHSGLEPDRAEASIEVRTKASGGFSFSCSNLTQEVAAVHVEKARTQIEENKELGSKQKLNKEGKSGLAKAAQLFIRATGSASDLQVEEVGGKFVITGSLPGKTFLTN